MKIGILTQPLHDNYGGLLQAYALKEVLKDMGHKIIIINRKSKYNDEYHPFYRKFGSIAKSILKGRRISSNVLMSKELRDEIYKEIREFKEKYFPELSKLISCQRGLRLLNSKGFDAYIVGSDQCWRPKYSPAIRNYFLDFAYEDKNVKRISYAASFGVSHWEFSDEDTIACKKLIQKFDAISVREDSAINLLSDHLDRSDAVHVLDPTMLLTPKHYYNIVKEENINYSEGNMKVYVLDKTREKDHLIYLFENKLRLKAFEVLPYVVLGDGEVTKKNIKDFVYPSPARWLRGFHDAKFVITDSFHGTVFSILHNIPFIAIGNKNRGLSRFKSLLKMFGLQDRLITDFESFDINEFLHRDIDWYSVNEILEIERAKAIMFLKESLEAQS